MGSGSKQLGLSSIVGPKKRAGWEMGQQEYELVPRDSGTTGWRISLLSHTTGPSIITLKVVGEVLPTLLGRGAPWKHLFFL